MLVVAVLIVVLPLFKKTALTSADGEQRNVKIAQDRLAELKQQLQDGVLLPHQYEAQYLELQLSLNDDLQTEAKPAKSGGDGRWLVPLLVLLLPTLSIVLYFHLADPEAIQKVEAQQAKQETLAKVKNMIPQLVERLKHDPSDLQGWLMLGKTYKYLEQFPEAAQVFGKLNQLQPNNVEVMLNYAELLALTHDGQLSGEPAALALKAVQLEPDNSDALWMAGMVKAEAGEAAEAVAFWQKLAGQLPADSPAQPQIQQMIAEVGSQPSAPAKVEITTNIHVMVDLDANIKAQAQAQQTVFIYAQALNGPKMPLAIVRKQVADLPLSVDLNDTLAMQPNMHLADFKQLRIVARISKSGTAMTQPGDFIGTAELSVPPSEQAVSIVINQEVK
jgi:cytochrome c-type biogenesis protein CcmH